MQSRAERFAAMAGTPVQNNLGELFGLLNLLDPDRWDDEDDFFELFGGRVGHAKSTPEQIFALRVRAACCCGDT